MICLRNCDLSDRRTRECGKIAGSCPEILEPGNELKHPDIISCNENNCPRNTGRGQCMSYDNVSTCIHRQSRCICPVMSTQSYDVYCLTAKCAWWSVRDYKCYAGKR